MNIAQIRRHLDAIRALLDEPDEADTPAAQPPDDDPTADLRRRIVEVALSQVGVSEDPPGSNDGAMIDQYMGELKNQGLPWCAGFVSWVIREALGRDHAFPPHVMRASAEKIRSWARANKRIVAPHAGAEVGAVFCMPRVGGSGHVGIVIEVEHGGTTVRTVEGNVNNRVESRNRGVAEFDMLVRVV